MLFNPLRAITLNRMANNAFAPQFVMALITLCLLAALAGCGSGGSSSSNAGDTGHFVLTAGDNPLDDFDKAIFDISSITLIGDDESQITVLNEMRSIDFLALETVNEVLAEIDLPIGHYSKLRLQVDKVTLVEIAEDDSIIREIDAKRVANGKVDVLVKGGFSILPGGNTIIAIDIDLEKSIKLVVHNNSYHFRPVIFASVVSQLEHGRLIRLAGEFEAIEESDSAFRLCNIDLLSDNDEVPETLGCRMVKTSEGVGVFTTSESGLQITAISNFFNGEPVVVYGHLMHLDTNDTSSSALAEESNEEYQLGFNAVVVANGNFERLQGVATTAFDTNNETFSQLVDADLGVTPDASGFVTHLPLSSAAVLYNDQGQMVDAAAITVGTKIETEGLVIGTVDLIDAIIGIVKSGNPDILIQGLLTSVDFGNGWLYIEDIAAETHCIQVTDDTIINELSQIGDAVLSSTAIDISTLSSGEFEVRGMNNDNEDCSITASSIVIVNTI